MAGVAELVDRAVALPPGPELSAALAVLPWEKVPNARLVEVVQARSRQLSHEHAEYYAGIAEIAHTVALESLPESVPAACAEAVVRAGEQFEWASREIAAGLTLTAGKADRELAFAIALCERLPLVHTALQQGRIDLGKARVFVDHLDPDNGEITAEQARRLCERFLPVAPGLTVRQLAARLYKALLAIDPQLRRRRYERAVQGRSVAVYLDPRSRHRTRDRARSSSSTLGQRDRRRRDRRGRRGAVGRGAVGRGAGRHPGRYRDPRRAGHPRRLRRSARGDPRSRPGRRAHRPRRGRRAAARGPLAVRPPRPGRLPATRRPPAPPTPHRQRHPAVRGAGWRGRGAPDPRRTAPLHRRPGAGRLARGARRDHPGLG